MVNAELYRELINKIWKYISDNQWNVKHIDFSIENDKVHAFGSAWNEEFFRTQDFFITATIDSLEMV